jgi:hypothetical protein
MKTNELRNIIEQRKGRYYAIQASALSLKEEIQQKKRKNRNLEQALEIVRIVGLETQQQLELHISDIASMALESVFDKPYRLILSFEKRRNKTECDILFERDGEQFDPMMESGGGTADIASFALRIASWSMSILKLNNVIILDEPFRFINGRAAQEKASEMVKKISDKLGIQFIIITNKDEFTAHADKIFENKKLRKISKVTEQ